MRSLLLVAALTGCAPALSDPSRFSDADVCPEDIQETLLLTRCARTGCHVPFDPASGVEFVSGHLAERLVGVRASSCSTETLIDPDAPEDSYLLQRVSEAPTCDGEAVDRMPLVGAPLDEAELACLRAWVIRVASEAR